MIEEFHRLWYSKGQFRLQLGAGKDSAEPVLQAHYCGYLVQKNPLDLWVYQEILWDTKPDLIIEMGTASGGTTLFLANQLDLIGNGEIISVDIDNRLGIVPRHPRITYLVGDSVDQVIVTKIAIRAAEKGWSKKVMVILDDDHTTDHVSRELDLYNMMVTPGQYLIVEDTNVDWPLGFGEGPGLAVFRFLSMNKGKFFADKSREKFLMTWNPGGYLRRL
jgi:cephalosporin hydroxylase